MTQLMQWWQALVDWLSDPASQTFLTTVALPFAAILAAGLLAVLIARASSNRVMRHRDDAEKAAAIAGLLAVSRRTTVWTSLSSAERDQIDYQITESSVRLRLLPISGADLAAEWSQGMITEIKRNSAALVDEAEKGLTNLEDGLIRWYRKPRAAKRQFTEDLPYLRMNTKSLGDDLIARQKQWQAQHDRTAAAVVALPVAEAPKATVPVATPMPTAMPVAEPATARLDPEVAALLEPKAS